MVREAQARDEDAPFRCSSSALALRGKIAERMLGGQTLTATLPVCLNALSGQGVHVVTVNGYLAGRGASVRAPGAGPDRGGEPAAPGAAARRSRPPVSADITHGTNNEYGFDYPLRDSMVYDSASACSWAQLRHRGQGGLHPDRQRRAHRSCINSQAEDHGHMRSHEQRLNCRYSRQEGGPLQAAWSAATTSRWTKAAPGVPDRAGPRERRAHPESARG